jgi:hypothetical protein
MHSLFSFTSLLPNAAYDHLQRFSQGGLFIYALSPVLSGGGLPGCQRMDRQVGVSLAVLRVAPTKKNSVLLYSQGIYVQLPTLEKLPEMIP